MKTDYELLYDYYLARQKEYRQETLDLLNKGETSTFKHGTAYLNRKSIEIQIENELPLIDVIKRLQEIQNSLKDNHSVANLSTWHDHEENRTEITVEYYEYSIAPESKCESTAKHIAKSAMWKIEHQSNSKDAIAYKMRLQVLKASI